MRIMVEFKYIKPEVALKYFSEDQLAKMEEDYFECKQFLDEIIIPLGEQNITITWFDLMLWVESFDDLNQSERLWIIATMTDYFAMLRARWTLLACGCNAPGALECTKCRKPINTANYTS